MNLTNAQIANKIYLLLMQGKFTEAAEYAADDIEIVNIPEGTLQTGRKKFLEAVEGWFSAFPDAILTITNQISSGNIVITEFLAEGTHTGVLKTKNGDVPPTGHKFNCNFCEIFTFSGGKLARNRVYYDAFSIARQLGLIPAAA